jgi:hypothetical protein
MRSNVRIPEVLDDRMAAVYREKTPGERLRIAFGLWSSARTMLVRILRDRHPDWDEPMIQKEAARRMSGGAA